MQAHLQIKGDSATSSVMENESPKSLVRKIKLVPLARDQGKSNTSTCVTKAISYTPSIAIQKQNSPTMISKPKLDFKIKPQPAFEPKQSTVQDAIASVKMKYNVPILNKQMKTM
jgi:hypothetical protein